MSTYTPTVLETIERLRRSILVHSYIYYMLDDNLISDHEFDRRCKELVRLQELYPEHSSDRSFMAAEFRDFTGGSGFHLPYSGVATVRIAERLLAYNKTINK